MLSTNMVRPLPGQSPGSSPKNPSQTCPPWKANWSTKPAMWWMHKGTSAVASHPATRGLLDARSTAWVRSGGTMAKLSARPSSSPARRSRSLKGRSLALTMQKSARMESSFPQTGSSAVWSMVTPKSSWAARSTKTEISRTRTATLLDEQSAGSPKRSRAASTPCQGAR